MTDATEFDEAAIRARVEAATRGPWRAAEQYDRDWWGIQSEHFALASVFDHPNAVFIAHARTDLPAALDEITRLRAALTEARKEVERREFEHDERCESEYESGAHAWTPCGCWASRSEAEGLLARTEAAEKERDAADPALAAVRTLARSWSGRHDLLMTGDSAAHDIEAALAATATTDEGDDRG